MKIKKLISLCLAAAGILSVAYITAYKSMPPESVLTEPQRKTEETSRTLLRPEQNENLRITASQLSESEYGSYGVSAEAETAYTLTATVEPESALNKELDWTVAFTDPETSWSAGKTVTDYVTVTPTSDGSQTAVVENKAAFGEQIKVYVTSRSNPSARAECTVDYVRRITGLEFRLTKNSMPDDTEIDSTKTTNLLKLYGGVADTGRKEPVFEPITGEGTIDDSYEFRLIMKFNTNFVPVLSGLGVTGAKDYVLDCTQGFTTGRAFTEEVFGCSDVTNPSRYKNICQGIYVFTDPELHFIAEARGGYGTSQKMIRCSIDHTTMAVTAASVSVNSRRMIF